MSTPLADKIRPKTLDDVVGQSHLLGKDKPLRRIIESGKIPNMIFYGSSGIGKTTVARIIAENSNLKMHKLNGTSASVADIKDIISQTETIEGYNKVAVSRAQEVRRWYLMERDLSLGHGELTATLKLKRNVVYDHYLNEINSLYQ